MRHRMAVGTGLGNPTEEAISGESTGNKKLDVLVNKAAKDCYQLFNFKKYGYCDAGYNEFWEEFRFGVEPAYMYDNLKLIVLNKNKELSRYVTGFAWGAYGSGVRQTEKYYSEYKNNSKFVKFVDKWYPILFKLENN